MTCLIFNVITVLRRGVCWERHVAEEDVEMGGGGAQGVALIALHFLIILFIVKVE